MCLWSEKRNKENAERGAAPDTKEANNARPPKIPPQRGEEEDDEDELQKATKNG